MVKFCCLGILVTAAVFAQSGTHSECTYFGNQKISTRPVRGLTSVTEQVTQMRPFAFRAAAGAKKTYADDSVDAYIFGDLYDTGITPAPPTTDAEFIRRVSFDLTGRPPE